MMPRPTIVKVLLLGLDAINAFFSALLLLGA